MSRKFARYARAPRPESAACSMNYPYAYFWRARFFSRYRDALPIRYRPTKPLLYLYGARSPWPFHSKRWEEIVRGTPGSEVVPIEGDHWLQVRDPAATHRAMDRFLGA
jgi:pimeloyl-ACP methyl ester carboxylesterase